MKIDTNGFSAVFQRVLSGVSKRKGPKSRPLDPQRETELIAKRPKPTPTHVDHDIMVQHVHAVAASAKSDAKAVAKASTHPHNAMRSPAAGLQLASVRVAPTLNVSGPKLHGFAWRAPKVGK